MAIQTMLTDSGDNKAALNEHSFRRMISLERKRSERSRKPFLLMLLDTGTDFAGVSNNVPHAIVSALSSVSRETDVMGWYHNDRVLGVMFTEIAVSNREMIADVVLTRINDALRSSLPPELFSRVNLSYHFFPENWDFDTPTGPTNPALYPDLVKRQDSKRALGGIKRAIDIAASLFAIIIGGPLLLLIAIAIKLTSKGPVFFRQERIGQYAVPFTFLKFRSMCVDTDAGVHKAYVRKLIAGEVHAQADKNTGPAVYKMTEDKRVTPVGRFLRRTSLDELPQFFNVLRGHMSLVGPRPAIAYEVEVYDIWHRARLLEAKPGITGLWQVKGRSRVKFDDMVRLDLQYARNWSPWLDIKILLQTPKAVVMGEGAF